MRVKSLTLIVALASLSMTLPAGAEDVGGGDDGQIEAGVEAAARAAGFPVAEGAAPLSTMTGIVGSTSTSTT